MQKGERVELLDDCDYFPYTYVCAGERGSVAHVNAQTGEVDILLDTPHPGLEDNCIWLLPERAVGPRVKVLRQYRIPNYIKAAAVVLFAVTAAALGPEAAQAVRGPAAEFKSFVLTNDHIHAGDDLILRNTAKRLRVCFWTWENSWKDARGTIISRTKGVGAGQTVTPDFMTYKIHIKTPPNLTPGAYSMTSIGKAECGHGDTFTVQQPTLKFTVEN